MSTTTDARLEDSAGVPPSDGLHYLSSEQKPLSEADVVRLRSLRPSAQSPVWPPFPGFGYEGAYEPVIAKQMVAEQHTPEGRKALGRKAGSRLARANAKRRAKAPA